MAANAVRGPHSTGVAGVKYDGSVDTVKKTVLPHELFGYKPFDSLVCDYNRVNNVLIGHNRYATKGAVNNINAHPFTIEGITGAHNGTLRDQSLLPDSKKFDVDSENIIHSIDHQGIEETMAKINGSMALSYWDDSDGSLNLIRNAERPLCYTLSEDGCTVYWASEDLMLQWVLQRNDIKYGDVVELEPNHLYEFIIPLSNIRVSNKEFQLAPRVVSLIPYKSPRVIVNYRNSFIDPDPWDPYSNYNAPYKRNRGVVEKKDQPTKGVGKTGEEKTKSTAVTSLNGYKVGDPIDFYTTSTPQSWSNNGDFKVVEGASACSDLTNVRVVLKTERLKELNFLNDNGIYNGIICSCSGAVDPQHKSYVYVRPDSITLEGEIEPTIISIKGWDNRPMTKVEYENLTSEMCTWCGTALPFGEQVVEVLFDNTLLCSECLEIEEVQEYVRH